MTAITEFLFPAPAARTARSIAGWWERRRLAYNAIVGSVGLLSFGATSAIAALPPDAHSGGLPGGGVVVVGILANLCYFLGPTVEIAIEKLSGGRILPTGPTLFRMGLTFSTGLVLLPTLVAGLDWGFRILRWIL